MTVFNSGPVNIEQGNSANFTLEFLDATGAITVPTAPAMVVNYINTSSVSQSQSVTLSLVNEFYTGTWASLTASLGIATWVVTSEISSVGATGQLRIIQRVSTY